MPARRRRASGGSQQSAKCGSARPAARTSHLRMTMRHHARTGCFGTSRCWPPTLRSRLPRGASSGRHPPAPQPRPTTLLVQKTLGELRSSSTTLSPSGSRECTSEALGVGANIVIRRELFEKTGCASERRSGLRGVFPARSITRCLTCWQAAVPLPTFPWCRRRSRPASSTEDVSARHRLMLRGQAAYALMLLIEGHGRRSEIVRYLMRAIRHPRQHWREPW